MKMSLLPLFHMIAAFAAMLWMGGFGVAFLGLFRRNRQPAHRFLQLTLSILYLLAAVYFFIDGVDIFLSSI